MIIEEKSGIFKSGKKSEFKKVKINYMMTVLKNVIFKPSENQRFEGKQKLQRSYMNHVQHFLISLEKKV